MNREKVGKTCALSCVEAYFAAYFAEKFDIRLLYAQSSAPFCEVFDKILNGAKYENYPLPRLQDTAEDLGLCAHEYGEKLRFEREGLHLILVNERFFENSKLTPWRRDHWIAVFPAKDGVRFVNSYPLSEGMISFERLREVYGGKTLRFFSLNKFCAAEYERMRGEQFAKLTEYEPERIVLRGEYAAFRDALAVLKVLRRRLGEWLFLELRQDEKIAAAADRLNGEFGRALAAVQLQLLRNRIQGETLQDIADAIIKSETALAQAVRARRGKWTF